ncbi:MAG: permease [Deltaproteobacteria bacterium]|nr:permease [Deltaproteobacteria bacterium]
MEFLANYLNSVWSILLDLSGPLLLGLFIAGLVHEFLPKSFIRRRLAGNTWRSVTEAALVGVPMPLCSCGVVPTAIGLRNDGASKGAATSFLISTPQTGVDSILVSATFLGWPFAVFKLFSAFVTGLVGGLAVNWTTPAAEREARDDIVEAKDAAPRHKGWRRITGAMHYAAFDLFAMIDLWLAVGILAAAFISVLVPPGYLQGIQWTQGIGGMLLTLAIAMPLYVCTTSSVPIAASLIAAGMPTGTALVFLMAGPATNIATMGLVYRALGARVLAIYLSTIAVFSIAFGLIFDRVIAPVAVGEHAHHVHHPGGSNWIAVVSTALVLGLLAFFLSRRIVHRVRAMRPATVPEGAVTLTVEGMSCVKCVAKVKDVCEASPGVTSAEVNLAAGRVTLHGADIATDAVAAAIRKAGYKIADRPA